MRGCKDRLVCLIFDVMGISIHYCDSTMGELDRDGDCTAGPYQLVQAVGLCNAVPLTFDACAL